MDFAIDHDDGLAETGYLPLFMLCSFIQAPQGIMIPDFSFYNWPSSRCPGENSRLFDDFVFNSSGRLDAMIKNQTRFFESKKNDLFWRGASLMNPKREQQLEKISNASNIPENAVDAKLMEWIFDANNGENLSSQCVTMNDHCDHRFLLHLQGNTYSSRLKYLLMCGSVVLMPQQEYEEWWYPAIPSADVANEDNEIVVHIKNDISDFSEKFKLFHDPNITTGRAIRTSRRALEFSLEVFSEKSVDCYWGSVIIGAARAWGRLLDKELGVPLEEVLMNPNAGFSNL